MQKKPSSSYNLTFDLNFLSTVWKWLPSADVQVYTYISFEFKSYELLLAQVFHITYKTGIHKIKHSKFFLSMTHFIGKKLVFWKKTNFENLRLKQKVEQLYKNHWKKNPIVFLIVLHLSKNKYQSSNLGNFYSFNWTSSFFVHLYPFYSKRLLLFIETSCLHIFLLDLQYIIWLSMWTCLFPHAKHLFLQTKQKLTG